MFKEKYRIIHTYWGYNVQSFIWWFPVWIFVEGFDTFEQAKKCIKGYEEYTSFKNKVIKTKN